MITHRISYTHMQNLRAHNIAEQVNREDLTANRFQDLRLLAQTAFLSSLDMQDYSRAQQFMQLQARAGERLEESAAYKSAQVFLAAPAIEATIAA